LKIIQADCVDAMRDMDEASVDAIVTDPPYHLTFMGRSWDHAPTPAESQRLHLAWATEALRVLKPGGHLLAFGGTRTYHRLACAVEDAGFEIRDSVIWLYGSGFPKSLDVSKAIDKAAGAEREIVGKSETCIGPSMSEMYGHREGRNWQEANSVTAPATPEAQQWQGWGTALKPAHEPIVLARKPLIGTVAQNVLEHGTGAINVDGCRVDAHGENYHQRYAADPEGKPFEGNVAYGGGLGKRKPIVGRDDHSDSGSGGGPRASGDLSDDAEEAINPDKTGKVAGRWPANVALSHLPECERVGTRRVKGHQGYPNGPGGRSRPDYVSTDYGSYATDVNAPREGHADPDGTEQVEAWRCAPGCPVAELDRQSGEAGGSGRASGPTVNHLGHQGIYGSADGERGEAPFYGDTGGASRFFYVAKASRAERNAGLDGFEEREMRAYGDRGPGEYPGHDSPNGQAATIAKNSHPTVKPIDLMRWLVRLVTPPGGTVLDPFAGSGTTGIAATLEDFDFIGIEREAEYADIARARIEHWQKVPQGTETKAALKAEAKERKRKAKAAESGQGDLLG
jgi:DNA modification methylase